jgi:hypothetical protein
MIARDFKALEAMLHGDLLYTHSSGVTDTKATWLQSMQSGKTKYKSVNCTDRKVRVIGEVALVTGRAAIEAEIGGQPRSLKLLFLRHSETNKVVKGRVGQIHNDLLKGAGRRRPRAGSSSPGSRPRSWLERGLQGPGGLAGGATPPTSSWSSI